jgi:serine/threonine protein kinase
MPAHYCGNCSTVAFEEDDECVECGTKRPEEYGWPLLRDSLDPWLGRVLDGRYLLTRQIGVGASASVYRAESLAISRQFAIKIIHPAKSSSGPSAEQIAARLEREIEALGRLRNPHIVRFYDVIELPLNHIGVVMDFVEGDTLEELVQSEGGLDEERASLLLRQICNGVYEAHLSGMTHRDLKPENIMVERLPVGDEFVHVLDFGIVHLDGETTMTHGFIGTPLYASPEQAMGEAVDHRSDIYALGAIFFFMLTGRPPFLGEHVMQVLRQHVERPAPKVTEALGRKTPGLLAYDKLVRTMLSKEMSRRPQSLAEVIHALDQHRFERGDSGTFRSGAIPVSTLMEPSEKLEPNSPSEDGEQSDAGASAEFVVRPSSGTQPGIAGSFIPPRTRVPDEEPPTTLQAESSAVVGMDALELPDGFDGSLFSCSSDFRLTYVHEDSLYVCDMAEGEVISLELVDAGQARCLALGQDHVLVGRVDGKIDRYTVADGLHETLFESVFADEVVSVAIGPGDQLMLAAMASGKVYMSAVNKEARDWVRVRGGGEVRGMTLSPRGDVFAVVREGGDVEISRSGEPKQVRVKVTPDGAVRHIAFSEDGYLIGMATRAEAVGLHQVINGMHMLDVALVGSEPLAIFFSSDNVLMGFVHEGNSLRVLNLQATREHA